MKPKTRKDLDTAPPGIYLVRCQHPSQPMPDDVVLDGPLPDKTPADRKAANRKADVWRRDIKCEVEVMQVIGLGEGN